MKSILLIYGLLLVAVCCRAADDGHDQWMKTFYKTQDITQFDAYWQEVERGKWLEQDTAIAPTASFVSQVLHQYPALIKGHLDDLKKIPKSQFEICVDILWLSDTPDARRVLEQINYHGNDKVPSISDKKIEHPEDLDYCWGWFFATGDPAALDRIISALEFGKYSGALEKYKTSQKTETDKEAAYKEAIFKAAMWSLGVNGKEDDLIAKQLYFRLEDPSLSTEVRLWLSVILSQNFPDRYKLHMEDGKAELEVLDKAKDKSWHINGRLGQESESCRSVDGFGAMMMATADPDWRKKWNTPSSEPFQCSSTTSLRRSEKITLLLSFTNPLPDHDNNIAVVYDVKITNPSGKVNEQKNLLVSRQSMNGLPLDNVFMAQQLMGFSGDKDDPAGEWVFEFFVRDLNRKIMVPLKLKITLKDK